MAGVFLDLGPYHVAPAAVDPTLFPRFNIDPSLGIKDLYYGGLGEIRGELPGLTTFDGVPGSAKVYVLDRKSMHIIRATRSASDGTYRLTHLKLGVDYLVLGIDQNDQDNAVVMDRVQAGVP